MKVSLLAKFIISYLLFAALGFAFVYFGSESIIAKQFKLDEKNFDLIKSYMITVYVAMLIIALIIFGIYFILIILPIKWIRKAAMEYAKGNFEAIDYNIKTHDELNDLVASIKIMSDHLSNTRDYQRDFISNISHDFRSPLTSIRGYLEAMLDGTIPPSEYEHYLKTVLSEANRLENLTTGLLEMDGYGGEGLELILENFDMEQVITEAVETFEGRCAKKNLEIVMKFPSKHYLVNGDKGKYEQVLYNLLDNAIKFSNHNSKIIISLYNQGDKQYCSVKDFGPGIPSDKIDKIFQRFYKSDSSRGRDKTGNGIGLSIVKEIIMAHNETIDVISTEGAGCEFVFSIKKAK